MSEHTPGRLELHQVTFGNNSVRICERDESKERGCRAVAEAEVLGRPREESEANARRIVACWNACDGVPTDELEAYTAKGGALHFDDNRIASLERDLAAVRGASLDELQARVAEWHDRNFGDPGQLARALIVCEEAGELAHVILKQHQGIRPESSTDEHLRDAMGDIVIALCALAASRGWSLRECVAETADTVLARDWTAALSPQPAKGVEW